VGGGTELTPPPPPPQAAKETAKANIDARAITCSLITPPLYLF
jgi:hypothetical protein